MSPHPRPRSRGERVAGRAGEGVNRQSRQGRSKMAELHAEAVHRHEAPKGFIWKYVFSLDHKVIGKQYYFLALLAVLVGIVLSLLMRLHLVWPKAAVPLLDKLSPTGAPGGVMTPEYYL